MAALPAYGDNKREGPRPAAPRHIGIIGAGLSGLRCAHLLHQHGFKVSVLEARDRVGGRMTQTLLPNGFHVDLGPNWVHGTVNSPMADLAEKTDTTTVNWGDDVVPYTFDQDGHLLGVKESEESTGIFWGLIEKGMGLSEEDTATIDSGISLYDWIGERLAETIPESEDEWRRKRQTVLHMSEVWGALIGSPIQRQSMKFLWLEKWLEGDNLFLAGTYKKILDAVAEPVLATGGIRFDTKVVQIGQRTESSGLVEVKTEGGQTLAFDDVVVTCPLGWLKKNKQAFEPKLPPRFEQAVDAIGYGGLEKVYLTFPEAFWKVDGPDGRRVQPMIQFVSPGYAPSMNPRRYNQEVFDLAAMTDETSHPTLLFYIYGPQSRDVLDKLASLSSQSDREAWVFQYFEPYFSRLPGYDPESPACQPASYLATDWLHDDLAGNGSYCNFQVGLENGGEDVEVMRQGLPDQGLWFAGEHTSSFVGLGTATGAYWSGERVARRITEVYGKTVSE